jgi:hypothetical protein
MVGRMFLYGGGAILSPWRRSPGGEGLSVGCWDAGVEILIPRRGLRRGKSDWMR